MLIFLLFSCAEVPQLPLQVAIEEEVVVLDGVQSNLTQALEVLSAWQSSLFYRTYLDILEVSEDCPTLFDSVQQMQGWNEECQSSNGWYFSGRAQLVYLEDSDWEGEWYQQIGSFINDAAIQSPDGGLFQAQGYGDLRCQEEGCESHMTGWFEMTESNYWNAINWMNGSLSFLKSFDSNTQKLQLSGGISQSSIFDAGWVSLEFQDALLDLSQDCQVERGYLSLVRASGGRIQLPLNGPCENCIIAEGEDEEVVICWNLETFAELRW